MGLLSTPPHMFTCGVVILLLRVRGTKKGNFSWLSRKTVGGLAQQGVSNDTLYPIQGRTGLTTWSSDSGC